MTTLLTTAEAAARTGYAARTLRDMIAAGTLPAVRVGRDWAIKESDLRKLPPNAGPGRKAKENR